MTDISYVVSLCFSRCDQIQSSVSNTVQSVQDSLWSATVDLNHTITKSVIDNQKLVDDLNIRATELLLKINENATNQTVNTVIILILVACNTAMMLVIIGFAIYFYSMYKTETVKDQPNQVLENEPVFHTPQRSRADAI